MAVTTNLASTVLMAVFLVAVVGVLARFRARRSGQTTTRSRPPVSELPQTAVDTPASAAPEDETPVSWVIGFVALIVLAGGGAVAFTAGGAPRISTQMAGVALAVVLGGLLFGYLFSGIYLSLRSHGRKSAEATGVALWLLGLIAVGAIATQLVFLA